MFEVFKKFLYENKGKYGASVVILFDPSGKALLLKRSKDDDWMPGKWGFTAGKIEKNETEEEAGVREVFEEAGIKINKNDLEYLFKKDKVYYFVSQLSSNVRIKLDKEESSSFKWVDPKHIKTLECVPYTLENIIKASKQLDKDTRKMWNEL